METTFISIHDLTPDARILYSSDSIIDILGYTPDEIVHRSAWEFFPIAEVMQAQRAHRRRVMTDKAAVLAYCRIASKSGEYIGCEVCFTVVYDVMVVCTSIYRQSAASDRRALDAPLVRRLFSSSPKDPRYHMLSHLSHKFTVPQKEIEHEPRAALFLNRFTRTLSIMYATNAIYEVIGISADELRGRSFYYCIAEDCLLDAVKCLENAKGNDSIAYLRFWYRDPRQDDQSPPDDDESGDEDVEMTVVSESTDGGVHLTSDASASLDSQQSNHDMAHQSGTAMEVEDDEASGSRTSSGDSVQGGDSHEAIFGQSQAAQSSTSSLAPSPERIETMQRPRQPIELEAVVSCASDGLVVCLRRARPLVPQQYNRPESPAQRRGIFAAPWALEPTLPPYEHRGNQPGHTTFTPSLGPHGASATMTPSNGPEQYDFMNSIREQAVFAWALTGINGALASYGKGVPFAGAIPEDGLPIWANDPRANKDGYGNTRHSGLSIFGDPGLDRSRQNSSRASQTSNTAIPKSPEKPH